MRRKRWIATLLALLILAAGWIAGVQLALADAKLKDQGISAPAPAQLKSALIGDAEHPDVLALRAAR